MLPLFSTAGVRRFPTLTVMLIAANLGVFCLELIQAVNFGPRGLEAFLTAYSLVPERLLANSGNAAEWTTLLTHQFLHGGFAHLAGNLWFLWVFGRSVEDRLGSFSFLLLYVGSGIAAAGLQIAVNPGSDLPMLGASGAISGVLGAYLVVLPGTWIVALVPWIVPILPVPAVLFIAVWFLLQMLNGVGALMLSIEGGVAWWAHAGGFLAGYLFSGWLRPSRRRKVSGPRDRWA